MLPHVVTYRQQRQSKKQEMETIMKVYNVKKAYTNERCIQIQANDQASAAAIFVENIDNPNRHNLIQVEDGVYRVSITPENEQRIWVSYRGAASR